MATGEDVRQEGYSDLEDIMHHRKRSLLCSVFLELQKNSKYLAKVSASIHEPVEVSLANSPFRQGK